MLKTIEKLSYKRNTWQVFNDFLEIAAITISNTVDKANWDEREKRYLEIVGRYEKKEIGLFVEMYGKLIMEMERHDKQVELRDVLGELFHALNLHNKWKGQYFTPHHVANMMAEMIISNCDEIIKEKGYITANEPACGSGVMVLGIANALRKKGFNHQKNMVVIATDIDIKCVHMAYIQFALYGIPAVVIHGNTLTNEEWSRWYTPMYAWNSASGRIKDVAV